MIAGRTGGTVPANKYHGVQEERMDIPSYKKDVISWTQVLRGDIPLTTQITNKSSGMIKLMAELASNADWKNQPIRNVEDPALQQVWQVIEHAAEGITPISMQQQIKGTKKGSRIGLPQQLLGIRPASGIEQDPEANSRMRKAMHDRDWKAKLSTERKMRGQYD